MTNPTTPLPVQEPAGAVEALKLAERLKAICDSHIDSASAHEAAYRLIESLASLPPVTQEKSEAWQWRKRQTWFAGQPDETSFWSEWEALQPPYMDARDLAKSDPANYELRPLYAAPQEAVERQPLKEATCEWSQDGNEDGSWFSACDGDPWYFESDDPTKNGMRFCIHCGKRMVQHGIGPATQEKP